MIKKNRNNTDILNLIDQAILAHKDKVPRKGEDSYLINLNERAAIVACFDGCGGIGSRQYEAFKGHTGAFVASKCAAQETNKWFETFCAADRELDTDDVEQLKEQLTTVLKNCEKAEKTQSILKGSLMKSFPTTLAAALLWHRQQEVVTSFLWSGDSRGYVLDGNGLHQITVDDVDFPDAMSNLQNDGALTNVLNATRPYEIHRQDVMLGCPCIVFSATDGCFGYLNSPMMFELVLLNTLEQAENPIDWENRLKQAFAEVAGDDFTFSAVFTGFGDFAHAQNYFRQRYQWMMKTYGGEHSLEELQTMWEHYKVEYEQYRGEKYERDN